MLHCNAHIYSMFPSLQYREKLVCTTFLSPSQQWRAYPWYILKSNTWVCLLYYHSSLWSMPLEPKHFWLYQLAPLLSNIYLDSLTKEWRREWELGFQSLFLFHSDTQWGWELTILIWDRWHNNTSNNHLLTPYVII